MWIRQSTDLISKVLSPAVKLWLRSQVEQVEELKFKIQGQDAQILRGYIPTIELKSSQAVYQGLHLGEVELQGNNIRINIGQVLRGKPLKLLEPISLKGKVHLTDEDLRASLVSTLLLSGLSDLWRLLQDNLDIKGVISEEESDQIIWQNIKLNFDEFYLVGEFISANHPSYPLEIYASLSLINPHTLGLKPKKINDLILTEEESLSEISIDLGSEVQIESFSLKPQGISCQGRFMIQP